MTIRGLTLDQHKEVLTHLVALGQSAQGFPERPAGWEYTSLLVCFYLHNLSCARSLLTLGNAFGNEWFPVTPGYAIARSLFETEVNAHYIAANPATRAKRYLDFVHVLDKREMDACAKHRGSADPGWRQAMDLMWRHGWQDREEEVNLEFRRVAPQFQKGPKNPKICTSWAGKNIREMAVEVHHEEAYDIFYAYLSSYAHANIRLADRFVRATPTGPVWSMRAPEFDVANVFRHTAIFFTCFLEFLAAEFDLWDPAAPRGCWERVGV